MCGPPDRSSFISNRTRSFGQGRFVPGAVKTELCRSSRTSRPVPKIEKDALDAYSRAVREVTESLEPAVISVGAPNGRGGGSGVTLGTEDGSATAVTNSHVVSGIRQASRGSGDVQVTLSDGSSVPAEVLGDDPQSDLAVVRFGPEREVTVATLGEAENLVVGQLVVAIGNPLAFSGALLPG